MKNTRRESKAKFFDQSHSQPLQTRKIVSPFKINKEKLILCCIFELHEAFTTRIHQKNMQKPSLKAKTHGSSAPACLYSHLHKAAKVALTVGIPHCQMLLVFLQAELPQAIPLPFCVHLRTCQDQDEI